MTAGLKVRNRGPAYAKPLRDLPLTESFMGPQVAQQPAWMRRLAHAHILAVEWAANLWVWCVRHFHVPAGGESTDSP